MIDTFLLSKIFSISRIPQIVFGNGSLQQLPKLIDQWNMPLLLVTGGKSYSTAGIQEHLEKVLPANKYTYYRYEVSGEPSPETIDSAISTYKSKQLGGIIAIGGGSVMDAGKAISAMMVCDGNVKDYLEGVGTLQPSGKRLPLIAIPTTSGTGSEATKNAVITEYGVNGYKKSLRHDAYVPDYAIIDPQLTLHCPKDITAASGMDAFTQLLESYLSTGSNTITDALALSGLASVAHSLDICYHNGNNIEARTNLSYAALLSGITLANAGLGVIHGFAQPLGSLFPIPHGLVCGTLMGAVNRITVSKLRQTEDKNRVLEKYARVGQLFCKEANKDKEYYIEYLLETIDRLTTELQIPGLGKFGVSEIKFEAIIEHTGMKNHPVELNESELKEVLLSRL